MLRLNPFWILLLLVALSAVVPARAQVNLQSDPFGLTIEGYANVTVGSSNDAREDFAIRGLGRLKLGEGLDLGLRVVAESTPEDRFDLAEASILLIGGYGRLELGQRQGLPDVLTGYAPNNFAFTGAEFGPASGPSLDPGGGLQHALLPPNLASQLNEVGSLGAFASLAGDRSSKFVYVSPKRRGFLAGFSYSPDSDDPRFGALVQGGLVHERYWDSNILRLGGSVTYAQPRGVDAATRANLRSFNVGATLILDDDLILGISATWNGSSGIEKFDGSSRSSAYGATASVNYNRGPWTVGGYVQWASAEGDVRAIGADRLAAFETGISYRFTQKVRVYGAWYYFSFDNEGGWTAADRFNGDVLLLGVRATL